MKLIMTLSLFIASSLWASAVEQKIATITSNIDTNTGRFYLITDERGDADSLRYTITTAFGRMLEDDTYPWERVRDGVVLILREGREVVRLYLDQNFSPETGGGVRINYLYSGLTGVRNNLNLTLSRQGDIWRLVQGTKEVNRMLIKGNWHVLFGLVGSATIETSFAPVTSPFQYDDYSSSFE